MENEDHGRCNTCSALISFKGGSTGNLIRHLKTKHAELDLTPSPKEDAEIVDSSESESIYEEVAFDSVENDELAKFVQLLNPKYKFDSGTPLPFLNEVCFLIHQLRILVVWNQYYLRPINVIVK